MILLSALGVLACLCINLWGRVVALEIKLARLERDEKPKPHA